MDDGVDYGVGRQRTAVQGKPLHCVLVPAHGTNALYVRTIPKGGHAAPNGTFRKASIRLALSARQEAVGLGAEPGKTPQALVDMAQQEIPPLAFSAASPTPYGATVRLREQV